MTAPSSWIARQAIVEWKDEETSKRGLKCETGRPVWSVVC
jgi:hypothetical protein